MSASTFSVTILEKEYQVACPKDQQAELLLSARHLDEQMRAIRATGKVIGLERIAVMAALNISHELLQARNGVAAGDKDKATESNKTGDKKVDAADTASIAGLNAKLDEALHQLRQLEIG
ncbi:cell division protein ZapA [Congregibacter litoralis]|uniref:Cell division protein ZapA n=1 Tax=Congregibacter litoralis KT71 TaxID=314285 RepID=A4ABX1_9GAMM|nr:cell division protein ZapA [Congregibacter litoralis]EAQ96421.1 cell division protein ZapA [Congregibacter litoralis KT71]